MPKCFGLSKSEHLKSRKQIDSLFAGGQSFLQFPIRVSYQFKPSLKEKGLKIGVTASKKNFKKAVDRNRIKRLLRESYRLQKTDLLLALENYQKTGIAFFIYTDKEMKPFDFIKEAMAKCIKRLAIAAKNETHK